MTTRLHNDKITRIVIFTNGVLEEPRSEAERWVSPGTVIVAVNGGTRHALAADLVPDHVVGDLDSLPDDILRRLEEEGTRFHRHPPAKDETDLELALLWAAEQDPDKIVVLGALGGRPDQMVANLLLLSHPALAGQVAVAADGPWTIRLIRGGETLRLRGTPGDTVSLLPLGGDAGGVSTEGLAYPLVGESLIFGPARGVSNLFEAAEIAITLESGLLWCFHNNSSLDPTRRGVV